MPKGKCIRFRFKYAVGLTCNPKPHFYNVLVRYNKTNTHILLLQLQGRYSQYPRLVRVDPQFYLETGSSLREEKEKIGHGSGQVQFVSPSS